MEIEWDPPKALSNRKKHGISFSDVEPAFRDQLALSMPDRFSVGEDRFLLVGADATGRIVTICYTLRGKAIRVISARPATRVERKTYEKGIRF